MTHEKKIFYSTKKEIERGGLKLNAAGICVQGYVNKFIFSVKGETWLINVKHSKKNILTLLRAISWIILSCCVIRLMRKVSRVSEIFFLHVWMCPMEKSNGLLIACYNLIWRKLAVHQLPRVRWDAEHVPCTLCDAKQGWTTLTTSSEEVRRVRINRSLEMSKFAIIINHSLVLSWNFRFV